jgi:O-antigen ligase
MFISRGAIIITLLWVLYELIKNIKPKRFLKNLFIVAIFTLMIYVLLNNTSFGNILYLRFSQIFVSISEGGSWLGSRNDIIDYTVGFLQENPENVIFGIGPTMFRYIHPLGYSNTHNLLLDVFVEFGILTFIIFCIMILVMIYNSKNWFLVILTFIYAIFEGVNLLYNNGVIVTGYVLFVFLVTYLKIVRSKRTSRINLS